MVKLIAAVLVDVRAVSHSGSQKIDIFEFYFYFLLEFFDIFDSHSMTVIGNL